MLYHLTPSYFIKHRAASITSDTTKQGDKVIKTNQDDSESSERRQVCPQQDSSKSRDKELFVQKQSQNVSSPTQESSPPPCSPSGRTSPPPWSPSGRTSPPSWRSISVSTRWRWDDIWHTQNNVQREDFASMTSLLWDHALQFLDKYRADARSYPIEELYQFADQTGILERHKQLLVKPFHNKEVDMKIMYYELIKMLIAYERGVEPSGYDTTTLVGKIEGYQELTNRLQRYLNQRFIQDVDELKRKQGGLGEVEVEKQNTELDTSKLEERIQQMEKNYINLKEDHLKLKVNFDNIQNANLSLVKKITVLEKNHKHISRDVDAIKETNLEMVENIKSDNLDLKAFENIQRQNNKHTDEQLIAQTDIIKIMKIRVDKHDDELSLLIHNDAAQDERLDMVDTSVDNLKVQLSDVCSKADSYPETVDSMQHNYQTPKHEDKLAGVLEDILILNKENKVLIERIEADENKIKEIEYSKIISNEELTSIVNENQSEVFILQDEMKSKTNNIHRISEAQNSMKEQLILFDEKCERKWETVEKVIKQNYEAAKVLTNLVHQNNYKLELLDSSAFGKMQSNIQTNKEKIDELFKNVNVKLKEKNGSNLITLELSDKLNEVANKVLNVEREYIESRNKIKIVEEYCSENFNQISEKLQQNKTTKFEENFQDELDRLRERIKESKEIVEKLTQKVDKSSTTIDEVSRTVKCLMIDTEGALKTMDEKLKNNSDGVIQIKMASEVLEDMVSKQVERNNGTAVRMAQLSLLASNTKAEIENIKECIKDNATMNGSQLETKLNKLQAEMSKRHQHVDDTNTRKQMNMDHTVEGISALVKENKAEIDFCRKQILNDKHTVSVMDHTLDSFNSRMKILEDTCNLNFQNSVKYVSEKKDEMKQSSESNINDEEVAMKLEKKILNNVNSRISDIAQALAKKDQEIGDSLEKSVAFFSAQMQTQENVIELQKKQLTAIEDVSFTMRKDLGNAILEIKDEVRSLSKKEKQLAGIVEQTNILMIKDANLEGKLSELENIQTDMNNKLSNLESADVFLQEANRMLVEKVSTLNETSKQAEIRKHEEKITELDGKFQHMEMSIVNLASDIKDGRGIYLDSKQLRELKVQMVQKQEEMKELRQEKEQFHEFEIEIRTRLEKMGNNEALTLLSKKYNHLAEQISNIEGNLNDVKCRIQDDQESLFQKVSEQQLSLARFFETIEENFSNFEKTQKDQVNSLKEIREDSYEQDAKMAADELLVTRVDTLETELAENVKAKRSCMGLGTTNLWTLILEIYAAFRSYTLVVKSEGAVSEHQSDVLGVYRMVDSYSDRPVYKQEGGENYIYYSSTSSSWLVGTVVGHSYGWLRNGSTAATSARWLPDLITGWEYRPLTRGWEGMGEGQDCWLSDDGTLRIEALRDVDSIHSLIQDMKNSAEVE